MKFSDGGGREGELPAFKISGLKLLIKSAIEDDENLLASISTFLRSLAMILAI